MRAIIACLMLLTLQSISCQAASVSTLYVDDAASQSERSFEVKNTSNEVEYITLSVERRIDAQNGKFTTQPMTDLAQQEVLVSPAYFVLAPNGRQTVRITPLLEKDAQERLYYISVNPKLPPMTSEQPHTALRMISAYKVLYLLRPKNPIINYSFKVFDALQIHNVGNTSILLHRVYACPAKDSARKLCSQLQGERVKAGEVFTFDPITTAAKGYWIELQLAGQLKQEWVAMP